MIEYSWVIKMQLKLILDFSEKDSIKIVEFLYDYMCKNTMDSEIELELSGFNSNKSDELNNAFYAFYYANKFGVGLEFALRILKAYHIENQNINDMSVLANLFEEINCCKFDLIDALHEGDYIQMHEYLQSRYRSEGLTKPINLYVYQGEEKKLFTDSQSIIDYIKNEIEI